MRRDRGFSLLEVVLVVAVLVILAGALVPLVATAASGARNDQTRRTMEELRAAIIHYAKDTLRLPATLEALRTAGGVAGWNGPYANAPFESSGPGSPSGTFGTDGFGRAFLWTTSAPAAAMASSAAPLSARKSVALQLRPLSLPTPSDRGRAMAAAAASLSSTQGRLVSVGEDGSVGSSDDIEVLLDLLPVLRAETLGRLSTVNSAITLFNRDHLPTAPLPADWAAARAALIAGGYLPNDPRYACDAWGDAFVPDPPAATPVSRVASAHLATTPSSGG